MCETTFFRCCCWNTTIFSYLVNRAHSAAQQTHITKFLLHSDKQDLQQVPFCTTANPSRFPGIFPILTLSPDFLMSIGIFSILENCTSPFLHTNQVWFNSWSKYSMLDSRCGYFLGTGIEHCFAGSRGVQISALADSDSTSQQHQQQQQTPAKRKHFSSFLWNKIFKSLSGSPGVETVRHSVMFADVSEPFVCFTSRRFCLGQKSSGIKCSPQFQKSRKLNWNGFSWRFIT